MAKKSPALKKLVGPRLKVIRKALQLGTLQAMADELGVEHDRYSAWEKGKNLMPVEFGAFLEAKYNVSLSWLYSADPDRTALELLRRA